MTAGPAPLSGGADAPSVLKNGAFVRLWLSGAISLSGSYIGQVALVYYVYITTNSAIDVAYLSLAGLVPNLVLATVSGAIADRFERRRVMVLSDIVRVVSWAAIATVVLLVGLHLPLILVAVAVAAAFTALFYPAERALLPEIVEDHQIPAANAILLSTNQIVGFIAYASGGLLVATAGVVVGLYYDALAFGISALLIVSIVIRRAPLAAPPPPEPFWGSVRDGFVYLRRNVGLLELTLNAALLNFFLNVILTFTVVYIVSTLGLGASLYGVVLGGFSAGSAVGAVLAMRTSGVHRMGLVWTVTGLATALPVAALVLWPGTVVAIVAMIAIGVLTGYGGTTWLTGAQLIVPRTMQGRYFGVDQLGSIAILPAAQIVGSAMITAIGILPTYGIMAAGLAVTGGVSLLLKDLRQLGYRPGTPSSTTSPTRT